MDYNKLSDFEINELVEKATGLSHETYPDFSPEPYVWNEDAKAEFDPCNNASNAWQIIMENKMTLIYFSGDDMYSVEFKKDGRWFAATNKNPLRAAMIIFLMMQEEENG